MDFSLTIFSTLRKLVDLWEQLLQHNGGSFLSANTLCYSAVVITKYLLDPLHTGHHFWSASSLHRKWYCTSWFEFKSMWRASTKSNYRIAGNDCGEFNFVDCVFWGFENISTATFLSPSHVHVFTKVLVKNHGVAALFFFEFELACLCFRTFSDTRSSLWGK